MEQQARSTGFLEKLRRDRPLVCGIVNCTDDSFYPSSRTGSSLEQALAMARDHLAQGADLLDLGAESTRPGSLPVSAEVELERLLPVIRGIRSFSEIPLSIDTRKAAVARACLDAGADIINDISAATDDPAMVGVVSGTHCPIIIMHMQGKPETMQADPHYRDVVAEVQGFLLDRARALEAAGVNRERIILDPGLGFGKTRDHNMSLLRSLGNLCRQGYPVLLGHSRKSFIGVTLGEAGVPLPVDQRLFGTLGVGVWSLVQGARIFRVHDVAAARQSLDMVWAIGRPSSV